MLNDLPYILTWWFQLFLIGIIFLPLTTIIFKNFFDKGYAFSKILGLLLSSYLVWLLASLKVLPFSQASILIVLGVSLIINLILLNFLHLHTCHSDPAKTGEESKKILQSLPAGGSFRMTWKIFLFEELLFFAGLFFWSYVRAHEPSINGLEKYMDYGFVNSILKTKYFPPLDMWLSGSKNFINYYYFGHYVCAFLTKLSNIPSEITYNLRLADLLGLSFAATFSLAGNLIYSLIEEIKKKKSQFYILNSKFYMLFGGLLAATLFNFSGNLHTIIYVLKKGASYWYPDATRYIPYTIHEFPIYSYVVADLHGHLSDVPFVLLTISFIFVLLNLIKNSPSHIELFKKIFTAAQKPDPQFFVVNSGSGFFKNFKRVFYPHSILILFSLLIAVNAMTNFWDLPIYLILAGLAILYQNFKKYGLILTTILETTLPCASLVIFYYLFALPFNLKFINFSKGIDAVFSRSPFYQLLVLWGFFYFFVISFLIFLYGVHVKQWLKPESLIKNLSNLFGVKVQVLKEKVKVVQDKVLETDIFILTVIALSTFLIIFPEFLYIKDIYIKEYHRANTMFKLVYQSFMMLSIVSAYIIIRIWITCERKTFFIRLFAFSSSLLVLSVMIYPYFAIKSYYGNLKNYQSLDGVQYLKTRYPDDYNGLVWVKKNLSGQPVILEAVGESYTDYARISANTGIPTVLGWPVHEWLWRGSYDEAGKRTTEVQTMYTSKDLNLIKSLLRKYRVDYIFVGQLEKQKYSSLTERNFQKLGKVVFKSGETKIYKLTL